MMHKIESPEFDGDSSINGLQMANGAGFVKHAGDGGDRCTEG